MADKYKSIRDKLDRETQNEDVEYITFNKATFTDTNKNSITALTSYTTNERDFNKEKFLKKYGDDEASTVLIFHRGRFNHNITNYEKILYELNNLTFNTSTKIIDAIESYIKKFYRKNFNLLQHKQKIIKEITLATDFNKKYINTITKDLDNLCKSLKLDCSKLSYCKYVINNGLFTDANIPIELIHYIIVNSNDSKNKSVKNIDTFVRRYIKNKKRLDYQTIQNDLNIELYEYKKYLVVQSYITLEELKNFFDFDSVGTNKKPQNKSKLFKILEDLYLDALIKNNTNASKIFNNLLRQLKYQNIHLIQKSDDIKKKNQSEAMKRHHLQKKLEEEFTKDTPLFI